jgi:hypothetical protein
VGLSGTASNIDQHWAELAVAGFRCHQGIQPSTNTQSSIIMMLIIARFCKSDDFAPSSASTNLGKFTCFGVPLCLLSLVQPLNGAYLPSQPQAALLFCLYWKKNMCMAAIQPRLRVPPK